MSVRTQLAALAVVAGITLAGSGRAVVAAGEPAAGGGPSFGGSLLEMTPDTLARFGKALASEEGARGQLVAAADAAEATQKQREQQFAECQMRLIMSPEYQNVMQEMSEVMKNAKPSASWQQAMQEVTAKQEALQEKACGPDPSRDATAADTASRLREAEAKAAKENGFTPRQYAVLKERISPLCLADPAPPGVGVVKVPASAGNFYVYTAAEVAALRPRCPAFTKLLYPAAR